MVASGHVQEGGNATVLVKAGALLTIAIPVARDCKLDRVYKIVIISIVM